MLHGGCRLFLSVSLRLRSRRPMADLMQSDQAEMLSRAVDVPTRWLRMVVLFVVFPLVRIFFWGRYRPSETSTCESIICRDQKNGFSRGR